MRRKRNAHRILIGKLEGRKMTTCKRHGEYIIKIGFKEVG
jgi:hypothetical protein